MARGTASIKEALTILWTGGSIDYAYLTRGLLVVPDGCKQGQEKFISISDFLFLQKEGYIIQSHIMPQGHTVFPSNTPVAIYGLTKKGEEHLATLSE